MLGPGELKRVTTQYIWVWHRSYKNASLGNVQGSISYNSTATQPLVEQGYYIRAFRLISFGFLF